jgi:hypothetical protein
MTMLSFSLFFVLEMYFKQNNKKIKNKKQKERKNKLKLITYNGVIYK